MRPYGDPLPPPKRDDMSIVEYVDSYLGVGKGFGGIIIGLGILGPIAAIVILVSQ